MENDREVDRVMMNVKNSAGSIVAVSLISVRFGMKLLIYLMRLAKKGLLAAGLADNFKAFAARTEGKYTVYNIPLSGEKAACLAKVNQLELKLQEEKNPLKKAGLRSDIKKLEAEMPELMQLKELRISHCVLPKLNGSELTIQVAVEKKDDQLFKNWFLNHLTTELSGGEKNVEEIRVLTEGNYAIYNVPFEGEELSAALPDFDTLGINYAILPDLKVGDGNSQLAIPNADRSKLETWFKIWKDKQLKDGKDPETIREMYVMDQNSYMDTGSVDEDEYIASSEPVYQEANAEFEAQAKEVPWTAGLDRENTEAYVKLLNNKDYERISINKESLVDQMEVSAKADLMKKHGYFISRVPGTYGENQKTLILPASQVFVGDEGKTYIAFLSKKDKIMVADNSGKITQQGYRAIYQSYDNVERNMQRMKELVKKPAVAKTPAAEAPAAGKTVSEAAKAAKKVAAKTPALNIPKP